MAASFPPATISKSVKRPEETGGAARFAFMLLIDAALFFTLWFILIKLSIGYFGFLGGMDTASSTIIIMTVGWMIVLGAAIAFILLAVLSLRFLIAAFRCISMLSDPPDRDFFMRQLGARSPSGREQRFIGRELNKFHRQGVRVPRKILILDNPSFVMEVYGEVLIVASDLVENDDFPPYAAHTLGHYNCSDARLHLAVNRYRHMLSLGRLIFLGLGVWSAYFREREFLADKFAADAGQRGQLMDALERLDKPLSEPVNERQDEVPPAEIRIDRLRHYTP